MANRLTKITTRTGDLGETSLGNGTRVPKTDPRVTLLGEVDTLNSWIGVVIAHEPGDMVVKILEGVQHDLFDFGGTLCFPGTPLLSAAHVARLDEAGETLNAELAPLKEFILPGGSQLLSWIHMARTYTRNVERIMAGFEGEPTENIAHALQYLNRLSDILFIAARYEAKRLSIRETLWEKKKSVS